MIALKFPERINLIREKETDIGSTFFAPDKTPSRFRSKAVETKDGRRLKIPTVDDVVRWSMTGKRAKGSYLDDEPEPISCSSGFCE